MAWGARPGLKPFQLTVALRIGLRLNGLGSPSGIPTKIRGEGGNQEKGARSEPSGERWEQERRLKGGARDVGPQSDRHDHGHLLPCPANDASGGGEQAQRCTSGIGRFVLLSNLGRGPGWR